jgi:regulatory protein
MNENKDLAKIKTVVVRLLSYREHSQLELRNKLNRQGFEIVDIEIVLQNCIRLGLQSDERFTDAYVTSRKNKGYGPLRIQQELEERGIEKKLVNQYVWVNQDWDKRAAHVREKKFGVSIPSSFVEQTKQMRFLQYRGFTLDNIKLAIQENINKKGNIYDYVNSE